jgi:hypothetical protein
VSTQRSAHALSAPGHTQLPASHVARGGHATPHIPQFAVLVFVSTQRPSHTTPLAQLIVVAPPAPGAPEPRPPLPLAPPNALLVEPLAPDCEPGSNKPSVLLELQLQMSDEQSAAQRTERGPPGPKKRDLECMRWKILPRDRWKGRPPGPHY